MKSSTKDSRHVAVQEEFREQQLVKLDEFFLFNRVRIRRIIGTLLRNSWLQLLNPHLRSKRYLNLGCGGNLLRDFINLDYMWKPGIDLCWNITRSIPIPDHHLLGIFSEHVIEHFTWDFTCNQLLPECLRMLQPGGNIRIIVPDAALAIDLYAQAKQKGLVDKEFRESDPQAITPMMRVDDTFRQIFVKNGFGHKFAYDFQTLEFFLHRAGFVEIREESYMLGRDPMLLVDYRKRAHESLYVEATAP